MVAVATPTEKSYRPGADFDTTFERNLMHYKPLAYGWARQVLRSRSDIDDIVADAVLLAWQHRIQYKTVYTFAPWFRRIVVNCCLMHLRRNRNARVCVTEPAGVEAIGNRWSPAGASLDPIHIISADYDEAARYRFAQSSLSILDPFDRGLMEAVYLRHEDRESVAFRNGLTVDGLRGRLYRASAKMRLLAHIEILNSELGLD